uniref:Uncharacterized protein n=1 Tax=Zooxanthella nutricula TaxID=1333877 RepID=A0A7S2QLN9_9DINO
MALPMCFGEALSGLATLVFGSPGRSPAVLRVEKELEEAVARGSSGAIMGAAVRGASRAALDRARRTLARVKAGQRLRSALEVDDEDEIAAAAVAATEAGMPKADVDAAKAHAARGRAEQALQAAGPAACQVAAKRAEAMGVGSDAIEGARRSSNKLRFLQELQDAMSFGKARSVERACDRLLRPGVWHAASRETKVEKSHSEPPRLRRESSRHLRSGARRAAAGLASLAAASKTAVAGRA